MATGGRNPAEEWQREAARRPIESTGDLRDDCTATWADLNALMGLVEGSGFVVTGMAEFGKVVPVPRRTR